MSGLALTQKDNSQADPPVKETHMFVELGMPPKRIGPHIHIPFKNLLKFLRWQRSHARKQVLFRTCGQHVALLGAGRHTQLGTHPP